MSVIGRLYLKILWLRKTASFYWAHKPLCAAYKADVLTIGTIRLCRSCFLTYAGVLLNLLAVIVVFPGLSVEYGHILLVALAAITLPLSSPGLYTRLPRGLRDICRFSLGLLIVQTIHALLTGHAILSLAVMLSSFALWRVYFRQRSARKIKRCQVCDEYADGRVCSGFARQMVLLREYEEEATEYVLSTGYVPKLRNSRE